MARGRHRDGICSPHRRSASRAPFRWGRGERTRRPVSKHRAGGSPHRCRAVDQKGEPSRVRPLRMPSLRPTPRAGWRSFRRSEVK